MNCKGLRRAGCSLPRIQRQRRRGRPLLRPWERLRSIAIRTSVCVSLCVCLSTRISPEPPARSFISILRMLPMAVARSSSGVIAIHYVIPVLWMTSCFFYYNWPYSDVNFATKKPISLEFICLPQNGTKFNFLLLKGIILTNHFEITRKWGKRRTQKFDD